MRKTWFVAARETQEVNVFMPVQKLAVRLQSGAVTPGYGEKTTMPLLIRGKIEKSCTVRILTYNLNHLSTSCGLGAVKEAKPVFEWRSFFISSKSVPAIIMHNFAGLF